MTPVQVFLLFKVSLISFLLRCLCRFYRSGQIRGGGMAWTHARANFVVWGLPSARQPCSVARSTAMGVAPIAPIGCLMIPRIEVKHPVGERAIPVIFPTCSTPFIFLFSLLPASFSLALSFSTEVSSVRYSLSLPWQTNHPVWLAALGSPASRPPVPGRTKRLCSIQAEHEERK
jgi:hypothetical protein